MSQQEKKSRIKAVKNLFFSITFTKKDGTVRTLNGQFRKYNPVPNSKHSHTIADNFIFVWDLVNKGWRQVNLDTLINFKCGKHSFQIA